mmetsp:Transcript_47646/g.132564  ORF Transcript_47646/g.132564 Transcript_47646/m.132564 type:complete len:290 (+) Transcript_47646:538-1407(+)
MIRSISAVECGAYLRRGHRKNALHEALLDLQGQWSWTKCDRWREDSIQAPENVVLVQIQEGLAEHMKIVPAAVQTPPQLLLPLPLGLLNVCRYLHSHFSQIWRERRPPLRHAHHAALVTEARLVWVVRRPTDAAEPPTAPEALALAHAVHRSLAAAGAGCEHWDVHATILALRAEDHYILKRRAQNALRNNCPKLRKFAAVRKLIWQLRAALRHRTSRRCRACAVNLESCGKALRAERMITVHRSEDVVACHHSTAIGACFLLLLLKHGLFRLFLWVPNDHCATIPTLT